MSLPCNFRNPSLAWRVLLVAGVFALPGFLAGELVSLFVGDPADCSVIGALLGIILGAVLEGQGSPAPQGPLDEVESESFDES